MFPSKSRSYIPRFSWHVRCTKHSIDPHVLTAFPVKVKSSSNEARVNRVGVPIVPRIVFGQGHIEMFLCDANDLPDGPDGTLTQSCFNKYPLDRAEDDEINQPIDPDHPSRMILDPMCRAGETDQTLIEGAYPGDVATARFQLPPGVTCERCVVQMAYCEWVSV